MLGHSNGGPRSAPGAGAGRGGADPGGGRCPYGPSGALVRTSLLGATRSGLVIGGEDPV